MAMPNPFQKLKHGVLLCKKNFNTFVETFNFLVDFAQNVRGDGDANNNGIIVFDRAVPDRPVIRAKVNYDYLFNIFKDRGLFKIKGREEGSGGSSTVYFENGYYRIGGKTFQVDNLTKSVPASSIVAVKVDLTGSQPTATLETFANMDALKDAEADTDYYLMPLYEFDSDLNVVCDFRIGPDAAAWEFAS